MRELTIRQMQSDAYLMKKLDKYVECDDAFGVCDALVQIAMLNCVVTRVSSTKYIAGKIIRSSVGESVEVHVLGWVLRRNDDEIPSIHAQFRLHSAVLNYYAPIDELTAHAVDWLCEVLRHEIGEA